MGSNGERNRATDCGDYPQIGTDYGRPLTISVLLCANPQLIYVICGNRFVARSERQSQGACPAQDWNSPPPCGNMEHARTHSFR